MDLSPEKIFVVGIIAVMVLGPDRLPNAARTAGKMLAEFRRWSSTVQHEVTNAIAEPREALGQSVAELGLNDVRKSISGAGFSLRGALNEVVNGAAGQGAGPAVARPALDVPFQEIGVTPAQEVGVTPPPEEDVTPGPVYLSWWRRSWPPLTTSR